MGEHFAVHFEIAGPDEKALEKFYTDLFGWTVNSDNPMNYGIVGAVEGGIGGGITSTPDKTTYTTVYISCDGDIAETLKKANDLGAKTAFDVMNVGGGGPTIASFHDPDGNFVGLVDTGGQQAQPVAGTGDPITWFEIAGSDAKKTQDFYTELFGWKINADNPMGYGEFVPSQGSGGGIFGGMGDPRVTVYATVKDLDATLKKAGSLGGQTVMEPTQPPGGPKIAMFSDPAGNITGLILEGTTGG